MTESIRPQFGVRLANLVMNLRLAEFGLVQPSAEVRDRFGLGQIENQYPEKTLRFFLLGGVYRTLPHPHNRLVVGSSPTGPTIFKETQCTLHWPSTLSRDWRDLNLRVRRRRQCTSSAGLPGFSPLKPETSCLSIGH